MQGRKAFIRSVACSLALLAVPAFHVAAQPSYRISREQLQRVLGQRFPLRYSMPGVLELEISEPHLRFLPEQNRLGSELMIDAAGPALARSHSGSVAMDFALRYEASDMSIRAHRIRVQSVRLSGLPRDAAALIDAYVRAAAERALLEVVLHQVRASDLALPNTMGFEPASITVESEGLAIGFVPRAAR
jgi:hypothetical protein